MRNKLLLASLGMAASMAVQAQTSVTFYGIIDTGIGIVNNGGTDPKTGQGAKSTLIMAQGGLNSSIYGFRGTEDLGGGLKAHFNLEGQFDSTDGMQLGNLFSRKALVGLSGPWGEVSLGRDWTPAFYSGVYHELNSYTLLGNSLAYWVGNGTRSNNGIFYKSPVVNGFMARAMVATGDWDGTGSGDRNEGKYVSLAGFYTPNNSGVTASAYYNRRTGGPLAASGSIALFGGKPLSSTDFGIGGGYKWDRYRVVAGYNQINPDGAPKLQMATAGIGVKLIAQDELTVQVVSVKRNDPAGVAPRANIFSASYVYPLSKRTRLYGTIAQANNNETGQFSINSAAQGFAPLSPGGNPKGLMVGITHTF